MFVSLSGLFVCLFVYLFVFVCLFVCLFICLCSFVCLFIYLLVGVFVGLFVGRVLGCLFVCLHISETKRFIFSFHLINLSSILITQKRTGTVIIHYFTQYGFALSATMEYYV